MTTLLINFILEIQGESINSKGTKVAKSGSLLFALLVFSANEGFKTKTFPVFLVFIHPLLFNFIFVEGF